MVTDSVIKLPILIIGVGNYYRGDDSAGLLLAQTLASKNVPGVQVEEFDSDGSGLLSLWEDVDGVIVIDAVSSGNKVGRIYRFEPLAKPLPSSFFSTSTHNFGVAEAIELARALDCLPSRLVVFGVEGTNFKMGDPLSPEVEAALPTLLQQILDEVDKLKLS
ncbi:MAG: hydrogenase maturation protease [Chloroflexi bacterium]|uniref:Hydrogenase maturation protease n=1 Tax=Candidatus Chlorohelix allophototropha TaxID=3003348 RepID=A0A8T7LQQ2_9CHLR|nr:hydrogenase maturation protease [Chloroflexota bacterium]WJW66202.1 hydrogenase maturation protease [Chloroflexota bacterium L227-S17]